MYRDWSLQQKWAATPLSKRTDVPEWLLDSPPHIILRIQGELDIGPTAPNQAFLPYRKALPLLDELSERIDSPIVPVIMSWERAGPWVYPDCFPPVGGEESLREFTEMARERGWRIGTFANGTRWVVGHTRGTSGPNNGMPPGVPATPPASGRHRPGRSRRSSSAP
jgi:hypothetical protein